LSRVDTGAMVSLIQPNISDAQERACDVQARGVTGTRLDISGEQSVRFTIRHKDCSATFTHTFVVSPLKRCSSGILGMDFLQRYYDRRTSIEQFKKGDLVYLHDPTYKGGKLRNFHISLRDHTRLNPKFHP
jgi:hypothetical protein